MNTAAILILPIVAQHGLSCDVLRAVCLLACLLVAGCDQKDPEPPPNPPAPNMPGPAPGDPDAVRITGGERLGWSQLAADAVEVARLQYAIYIDDVRSLLMNA